MQRVNVYKFYDLSSKLHAIQSVTASTLVGDCIGALWFARSALEELIEGPISLPVSRPAVTKVLETISSAVPPSFIGITAATLQKPFGPNATTLSVSLKDLATVLNAECHTLATYAISQKGAYSTSDLIENAELMLPESLREKVDSAVIEEIREAGRCLVFDLPTAAGFHVLRAVELAMLDLWRRKNPDGQGKKPPNWGEYIKQFKEAGVDEKTTTVLCAIKDLYRNPVNHPEDTLVDDEALTLFSLGIAAIQQMIKVREE